MKQKYQLIVFCVTILLTGTMMTACQNNPKDPQADIQQIDTPLIAAPDGVRLQQTDSIIPDTSQIGNMKDNTSTTDKKPLVIVIGNLASQTAPVEISVYAPQNKFPTENGQLKKYRFTPAGDKLIATITDLDYGQYAIATYQDLDADGKIGKNLIGIPTDPYGFSNNYRPRIKAPAFKDCKFDYNGNSESVSITMIKR